MTDTDQPPACVRERDITRNRLALLVFYGVPIVAIILTAWLESIASQTLIFASAFAIMGLACVSNARSCGRVHCAFTGPWFLFAAGASVAHGLGAVPLGDNGWVFIGNAGVLGAVILWIATESRWGEYFRKPEK